VQSITQEAHKKTHSGVIQSEARGGGVLLGYDEFVSELRDLSPI
jgi:hypothetical protein